MNSFQVRTHIFNSWREVHLLVQFFGALIKRGISLLGALNCPRFRFFLFFAGPAVNMNRCKNSSSKIAIFYKGRIGCRQSTNVSVCSCFASAKKSWIWKKGLQGQDHGWRSKSRVARMYTVVVLFFKPPAISVVGLGFYLTRFLFPFPSPKEKEEAKWGGGDGKRKGGKQSEGFASMVKQSGGLSFFF